jgi:Small, acid-soluble spore proteins, alpha/beta type
MEKANKDSVDLNNIAPEERLKYEIAGELGLLDKVVEKGWKGLSAKETGRIGGLVAKKKREQALLQ